MTTAADFTTPERRRARTSSAFGEAYEPVRFAVVFAARSLRSEIFHSLEHANARTAELKADSIGCWVEARPC